MSDFMLPDIGEGIVECEVVEWRVAEGDIIEEDQPIVEVMTDKALVEITAPEAGRITRLYVDKGSIAKVHAPLYAYVGENDSGESDSGENGADENKAGENEQNGEDSRQAQLGDSDREPKRSDVGSSESSTPQPAPRDPANTIEASAEQSATASAGKGPYGRVPASPAVRRLIREHELRLDSIPGSGKQGRVLKEDVLDYLEQGPSDNRQGQTTPDKNRADEEFRVEPLRGIRAVMAKRMVESATTIPHFQFGEEIDVTELLALRERLKPQAEARETRLTLMPLFMKALALAVAEHPIINARLNPVADEIHYYTACNIGMAVDSKAGLLVPNVKHVERLSVLEIAREVARLTAAARDGRVDQADLKGGTISISNIGALGGTYAAPIINAPEAAIVAIGKTQWLPRFDAEGNVVKRAIMTVTWAGDHRLIDGGAIARFCNSWKGYLEAPESMLLYLG
ncbi:2-oxo acid dehydrogenase subunit E2 [Halomonas sp. Bachu 37]|uniref:2-oxo acid dehydrogenase subunit E2 n=1 Tax=Halomonas kashgarensis TaxID=3084920 RepID=UPI0032167291